MSMYTFDYDNCGDKNTVEILRDVNGHTVKITRIDEYADDWEPVVASIHAWDVVRNAVEIQEGSIVAAYDLISDVFDQDSGIADIIDLMLA